MADTIILRAQCRIFEPNYRIIRCQYNVLDSPEGFPEYFISNLLRERGVPYDARTYQIIIKPMFPH